MAALAFATGTIINEPGLNCCSMHSNSFKIRHSVVLLLVISCEDVSNTEILLSRCCNAFSHVGSRGEAHGRHEASQGAYSHGSENEEAAGTVWY